MSTPPFRNRQSGHPMKLAPLALLAALWLIPATAQARPPGDAARGATLFRRDCAACHTADRGGTNGAGPTLYGVFGRAAAHAPGFAYSPVLKRSKLTWTEGALDRWLAAPTAMVPGTTMFAPPVTAARDRRDLVAYLRTRGPAKRS